ncbi:hypothetical protein SLNSH_18595 [Alsobacter soli]|uniref:Uncharacterized protein n=1 Tax=Alsobacter soli TaxID=2109933 RepID=A0A2T1HPF1_9HYPH|nr:hypothetical protein [Alsobacter soli]PSC03521.1 hypothetical protein SLNSH_18595 [Alsobacter soli]
MQIGCETDAAPEQAPARDRSRRGRILGLSALGLAFGVASGALWNTLHPPQFTATALLQASSAADEATVEAQARFAVSATVLSRAADQEKLASDPDFQPTPLGSLDGLMAALGLSEHASEGRSAAALRGLGQRLSVTRQGASDLLEIAVRAPAPEKAVALANAVATATVTEWSTTRSETARQQSQRAAARLATLQTKYFESETRLIAARQDSAGADPAAELARAKARAAELRAKVDQAQRLATAGRDGEAGAELPRSPALDRLQARAAEAARVEASYRQTLGPRHPSMVEAQQQLREARKALADEAKRTLDSAKAELAAAEAAEAAAAKRAAAAQGAPDAATARLRALEAEVEANRAAYEKALAGQASSDAIDVATDSLRLLNPATPDAVRASPGAAVALAAGAAVGTLMGLAAALLPLGRRRRGQAGPAMAAPASAGDEAQLFQASLSAALATPAASGEAPAVEALEAKPETPPSESHAPTQGAAALAAGDGPSLTEVRDNPDSPYALALRELARSVLAQADPAGGHTVLVTSLVPRSGKSTLAANLARAAATGWRRVLLVDANRRNPTLSLAFGLGGEPGLLRSGGRDRPVHALDGDWGQGLFFMPVDTALGGVAPALPLGAPVRFEGVAENFDLIVIDGPVAGTEPTDAALAASADQVLLASPPDQEADPFWASALLAVPHEKLVELPMAA